MRVTLESRVHQRHTRGGLQSSPPAGGGLNHGINRASGGALSGSGAWRAGVAGEASGAAGGLPGVPPAQGVPGLRSPLHATPPEPRPGQGDDALSRPGGGSPRSARQGVGAVSLRWGRPLPTSRRSPGARTSPWLPPPTRTRNSRPPPVPSPTQRLPPRQPGSLPSSLRRLASASLSGAHCAGSLRPRPSLLAPPSFRAPAHSRPDPVASTAPTSPAAVGGSPLLPCCRKRRFPREPARESRQLPTPQQRKQNKWTKPVREGKSRPGPSLRFVLCGLI